MVLLLDLPALARCALATSSRWSTDGKVVAGDMNSVKEALNGLQDTTVMLTVLRYSLFGPDTISVSVVRGSAMNKEEAPVRMQGRRDALALASSLAQSRACTKWTSNRRTCHVVLIPPPLRGFMLLCREPKHSL